MAAEIGITSGKSTLILGISSAGAKYRPKEGVRGATREPGGPQHGPTPGRATRAPGALVGPYRLPLDYSGSFWCADFYMIFREFIGHFKYWENLKYKNSIKQELALRCTELIGESKYDKKCMKVHLKHGKVTQIMHGASRNYRYVWDVSIHTSHHRRND